VAAAMNGYFEKANAASKGKDIAGFRATFERTCSVCLVQYRNFKAAYEQGQRAEGRLYESWNIDVQSVQGDTALVTTTVNTGAITLLGFDDEVITVFDAERDITTAWTLKNAAGGWMVIGAQDLP
jgi:hypothetical protein